MPCAAAPLPQADEPEEFAEDELAAEELALAGAFALDAPAVLGAAVPGACALAPPTIAFVALSLEEPPPCCAACPLPHCEPWSFEPAPGVEP